MTGGAGDELRDTGVGNQAAAPDDHQTGCGLSHFAHQMRRDEHRVPLRCEIFEHRSHPQDTFRVQTVDRLVKHDGARVAQQGRGDAESLTHAQREPAYSFTCDLLQTDKVDDLGDPSPADAIRLGQCEQMVARRTAGVDGLRLKQHTEFNHRRSSGAVVAAVHFDRAGAGAIEPGDHPHRGGFAGTVGPEETGDDP